jgi:ElaB/YqjD/DUF883 family membrane-anchored ribosome-binding protein
MSKHYKSVQIIDQIDAEMQEIMVELENLISQKYDRMDHEQKSINTEAFLQFFDRVMVQIGKK